MPFKIVQTIEKQQPKLTIVPAYWEYNGVLRLPKIGARKLVTNGDSRPLQGWVSMKCTVKRSSFQTYREAEEELTLMENKSDTDVPEHEGINLNSIQDTNYNSMAENLCQEQIMPFKIVQTIEKQQPKLTIVPAYWEYNGVLRLPKIGARKLVTNGDSRPLQGWVSMKCTVKRSSFQTYREAEEELTLMENKSDTDVPEHEGINLNSIQDTNYNSMAENLILLNRGTEEEIPAPRTSTSTAAAPGEIEYIISTSELPNTITDLQNVQIDTNIFEEILKNQNKILENQNVILQNQCVMQKMQQCVLDKEEINCKQISNLVVLVEDSFTRLRQQNKRETVVSLGDANAFEKESFYIKPLANVKELEELECKLSDNVEKSLLEQRFEFLCTRSAGKGINCAYKLLDIIFRRDFLCKCSWSGGSRGNATKIGLKGFKNVLSFFYNMVHSWDPLYTYEDNENFFKMVTKNATKRSEIKDLRASTKRKRQEVKESKNKKSKTETSQEAETVESSQENPNQEKEDREIENREIENQENENQDIENQEIENRETENQENNESENNEEESLC
ncbi:unnamed protein product [Chilo suppressalis]|uniref:DUF4806 domain-containing protein n=1 Tax=Chilo suppressalis TaxID=168631 RepID=A0ABN8ASI1_CHISP|nr:unnamed protein product [Chilo suppressalis]